VYTTDGSAVDEAQQVHQVHHVGEYLFQSNKQSCIKYFQKVFQLKITIFHVFQLLLSITKVMEIQNTFRSQSINIHLMNKRNKHISRHGIGTVTVQLYGKSKETLKILAETYYLEPD